MTKIPYTTSFNRDDVFLRNILVGAMSVLNRHVMFENVRSNDERHEVQVPFYFSTTGDERFLKDTFMNDVDSDVNGCVAESFYNVIPRCIVEMEDISITAEAHTNKFIRSLHEVESPDGELLTYSSEIYEMPITVSLNVTGYFDSHTDMLKFIEAVWILFYKSLYYNVEYKSVRVPCALEFPEDYSQERLIDFGFSDRKEWKVIFGLQIFTRMPIFKKDTSIFAGNRMDNINMCVSVGSNSEVNVYTNGRNIVMILDKNGNLVPIDPNLLP